MKPIYDFEALYAEFRFEKSRNQSLLLKEWCKTRNLGYTNTSAEFASIKRKMQLEAFQKANIGILLKAQSNVGRAVSSSEFEPEFSAKYNLEAYKAIADRSGFSPQAVTINMQQNNQTNIAIPPLFAQDADTEPDS